MICVQIAQKSKYHYIPFDVLRYSACSSLGASRGTHFQTERKRKSALYRCFIHKLRTPKDYRTNHAPQTKSLHSICYLFAFVLMLKSHPLIKITTCGCFYSIASVSVTYPLDDVSDCKKLSRFLANKQQFLLYSLCCSVSVQKNRLTPILTKKTLTNTF